jgi:hypothetical protein
MALMVIHLSCSSFEPVVTQQGEGNADDNAEADMQEDSLLVIEFASVAFQDEPQSLKDAIKHSDAAEWYEILLLRRIHQALSCLMLHLGLLLASVGATCIVFWCFLGGG